MHGPDPLRGKIIRDVSVLTCDRPDLLERCVASLRKDPGIEAGEVRLRILNDGSNVTSGHICRVARRAIARRLATQALVDEELVTFALCGVPNAGPRIGALRNTSLLLNAGRNHLQVDDDAICIPYVAPAAEERRVEVASNDAQVTVQWYGSGAAPLADLLPARHGFVEAHEGILGKALADLARENQLVTAVPNGAGDVLPELRVRVTQNSLVGDCGVTGPWWKTLRANAEPSHTSCEDRYESELLSREVLRKVDAVTVSRRLAPTAFAMGIDSSELVPPFLPCGRGEDAVFVFLLNLHDRRACEAQLPAIVQHRPHARPPFRHEEVADAVTHLTVPGLLYLLLPAAAGSGRAATLEAVGSQLLHIFRSWSSASDALVPRVIAHRRWMLETIRAALDGRDPIPERRRQDLRRQASVLSASLQRITPETLMDDIADGEWTETMIVQFACLFGELLQVWDRLWAAASEAQLNTAAVGGRNAG